MAISKSWNEKPGDYIAANEAAVAAGGLSIVVDFPKAGVSHLSAESAHKLASASDGSKPSAIFPRSVPADSFNVSAIWGGAAGGTDYYDTVTEYIGTWDFRDDYVNGSAPDDVSGIGIDYPSCAIYGDQWAVAADYENNEHNDAVYLSSSNANGSVFGVKDSTSGFKILTDHGTHGVTVKYHGGACDRSKIAASYTYEHNQDGNGGWSASIGVGIFNISYSGNSGSTLRKGTNYEYFPY